MAVFCPVEDVAAWDRVNRVQLFHDKMQRWVIAVAVSEQQSDNDVAQEVRAFMNNVFSRGVPQLGGDVGAATDFKILAIDQTMPGTPGATQRREDLDPIPFLKPGPVAYATLEFAWRGPVADMPWPVTRLVGGRLHGVNTFCPQDANIMLIATKDLEIKAPPRKLDDQGLGSGLLGDLLPQVTDLVTALLTAGALAGAAWIFFKLERS